MKKLPILRKIVPTSAKATFKEFSIRIILTFATVSLISARAFFL